MEELRFENGSMTVEVLALLGNNAFLKRINDDSFIVVNGLVINKENNTCHWAFAYGYYQGYNDAYLCFVNKILKPFMEYEECLVTVK